MVINVPSQVCNEKARRAMRVFMLIQRLFKRHADSIFFRRIYLEHALVACEDVQREKRRETSTRFECRKVTRKC